MVNLKNILLFYSSFMYICISSVQADLEETAECIGKYPVAFNTETKKRSFKPFLCKNCDQTPNNITLQNTRFTVLIDFIFADANKIPQISGGPLEDEWYRFKHIYFNWREEAPPEWDYNKINFRHELHVVFYSTTYGSYEEAVREDYGIVVLSMGFRVRPSPRRPLMAMIAANIKSISNDNTITSMDTTKLFNLDQVLPEDLTYFNTYAGTMISEKSISNVCQADVIWIDFEENHKIAPEEVEAFKALRTYYGVPLIYHLQSYDQPLSRVYTSNGQSALTECLTIVVFFVLIHLMFA